MLKKSIAAPLLAVLLALPVCASAQTDEASPVPEVAATAMPTSSTMHHRRHMRMSSPAPEAVETAAASESRAARPSATPRNKTQRFITETAAQAECPNDTVVWMNTKSHAIHHKGDRFYGKTKSGSYVCEHAK